jgi:hypothetical protein
MSMQKPGFLSTLLKTSGKKNKSLIFLVRVVKTFNKVCK